MLNCVKTHPLRARALIYFLLFISPVICSYYAFEWISSHRLQTSSAVVVDDVSLDGKGRATGKVGVIVGDGELRFRASGPHTIELPSNQLVRCFSVDGGNHNVRPAPDLPNVSRVQEAIRFDLRDNPQSQINPYVLEQVVCKFRDDLMNRDFARRSFEMTLVGASWSVELSDQLGDVEDLKMSGTETGKTRTWEFQANKEISLDWVDSFRRDLREAVLLIIGVLLGLAGAAIIELSKLFLDVFVPSPR